MLSRRVRKTIPTVVPYRSHPHSKWTLRGHYINGKRVRRFFSTKQDAERFVEEIRITTENLGIRATEIDQRLHVMAVECHDRLTPYGKNLADATDFYCRHLEAVQRSSTLNELVKVFLQSKEADGTGHRYRKDLRNRLDRFQRQFGERIVATITSRECDEWIKNLLLAPRSRNGFRRVLSAFFSYAHMRSYCADNPISRIGKAKVIDSAVAVLTPDQTERLLASASPELIPFIAIGAFAGLRTAELSRLDWKEIHLDRGFIEVSAAKSKTASRRLVTILPTLRLWLIPHVRQHGPVMPNSFAQKMKTARKSAGIDPWPANGLRHSYASYHLAKFQDAPSLALQLGHKTTATLFSYYREVVTPEAAASYWNIQPEICTLRSIYPLADSGQ